VVCESRGRVYRGWLQFEKFWWSLSYRRGLVGLNRFLARRTSDSIPSPFDPRILNVFMVSIFADDSVDGVARISSVIL
jgi:hypothetical protein